MPEQKLAAHLGDGLEGAIGQKVMSFGWLLTRASAIRILCHENGISTEEKITISQASATRLPFSFSARVDRVFPIQQFPGGSMRSARLHISDKSGEATLVLWNEQAKLAQHGILSGDSIECTGAYFRSGEIAIGKNGSVAKSGESSTVLVSNLPEGVCNVEGVVETVGGARAYLDRRSGEEKQMLSFSICSGGKCCRAVWWSPPTDAPQLRKGTEVVLEGASFRNGEIHLNNFSRVLPKGENGKKKGKFGGAVLDGESVALEIGEEKFSASLPEALSLLGLPPGLQGISPSTVLSIKAGALAGKQAAYTVEGGRLRSLEFEG